MDIMLKVGGYMDFLYGQESLTAFEWVLRAIIAYFFLLFSVKVMGQRAISQLRLVDFVMAISIGNIIAHPLSDQELGMGGSIITSVVLILLYLTSVFTILKSIRIRHFFAPSPIPLVRNGKILHEGLKKGRIPVDFLLDELRKERVEDVQQVALALLEADGSITSFLYPQHQTATKKDLRIPPTSFSLPIIVIREGKVDFRELKKAGQDENWLRLNIRETHQKEVEEILLATIDLNGHLVVYPY